MNSDPLNPTHAAAEMQTELLSPRFSVSGRQGLPVLDKRRRGATFVEHTVKSIINSPESTGMGFWSINPYVGCEFGCTYCYARYAHRYVIERAHNAGHITNEELRQFRTSNRWEVFEQHIFVKRRLAVLAALERDLLRMGRRTATDKQYPIVIGTATDPYQPAERQFRITRAILERLRREEGMTIGIITKSALVSRDIDMLVELQQRHRLSVYISLITTDVQVIKLFEARSPMPHVRLKALKRLADVGINAGLIIAPILPGITDTAPRIRALARATRNAGGRFAHPTPLRLYPALRHGFLPIVERHFPELAKKYRRAYGSTMHAPRHYKDAVAERFNRIMGEYGIPVGDPALDGPPDAVEQLEFWNR